ncbi:YsnF/AvaK domain-containing protein [Frondihabitans sp. VKM Ac-2883]|uniref:YsnF/AvaK domain-containing protein n=1 Tax=Frondihabitans sp. VKM Ac-2883 TaxID=2783823 RepID=UPI00188D17C9|nr:YsnF/AvaK domain-containing protein [Frondihabitans sp. VKM Ac-2883]MBF4577593.1 YsnF/AvaK domain-containing protein [Frondihabitans sp. VKM Ac-2883]
MISTDEINTLLSGRGDVVDQHGKKIGSIGQIFTDDRTGEPEWVTAHTGLFGGGESFVPLSAATVTGNDVQVPYTKDQVRDAPHSDEKDGYLTVEQESALYAHYGLEDTTTDQADLYGNPPVYDQDAAGTATTGEYAETETGRPTEGHDTSGANTDDAMTRSEEQLHVGTRQTEAGKARLRKYIVTEQETRTVPVSHDEVTITREPITDANRGDALSGADLTEEEHEIVLHEDKVVVDKEAVAVERIKLGTETVTENKTVTEDVRKEQIEFEDDTNTTGRTTGDVDTDRA